MYAECTLCIIVWATNFTSFGGLSVSLNSHNLVFAFLLCAIFPQNNHDLTWDNGNKFACKIYPTLIIKSFDFLFFYGWLLKNDAVWRINLFSIIYIQLGISAGSVLRFMFYILYCLQATIIYECKWVWVWVF